jgi:ABC-type polysaccharide transport system permease subunit
METIILLVVAVSLAYGVGCMGRKRKIGFGLAFAISLFNVVIGLIAVLCSKKIEKVESKEKEG